MFPMLRLSRAAGRAARSARQFSSAALRAPATQKVTEGSRDLMLISSAFLALAVESQHRRIACQDSAKKKEIDEFLSYVYVGDEEKVQEGLLNGMNVEVIDDDNFTPLRIAAGQGHDKLVKIFLSQGADLHRRPDGEDSAIMLAALSGHYFCCKLLIEAGARLEERSQAQNASPLMLAAANGHHETVELLCLKGAEVGAIDKHGNKAIDLSARFGHQKVVAILIQYGAKVEDGNDYYGMKWGGTKGMIAPKPKPEPKPEPLPEASPA